ncbi:MAG: chromate transporter [Candidatus Moranbacteria bacterium]|nr:chromate transporter [Candidatus Moranbacteria bacterium]
MILVKLFLTFLKVGLFTVGSGYSMLVLAQRYVVDHYSWLTPEEFTDIVAIAEVTPGPIMINLATFVGTRLAGFKGALFATGGLICLPFICIFIIALQYDAIKENALMQNIFSVIKPMAVGFIAVALIRLSQRSIIDLKGVLIVASVIILTSVFKVNPIYTIVGGVLLGVAL